MTEDEKKSALAAAKERIAKHAVGAAMAATTLTPNLASAQTAERSADFSPTGIERTVNTAPGQTIVMNAKEAANMPAFGSDEWLKSSLKQDCTKHNATLAEETKKIQESAPINRDELKTAMQEDAKNFDAAISQKSIPAAELNNTIYKAIKQNNENLTKHLETLYSPTDDFATTLRKDELANSVTLASDNLTIAKLYTDLKANGITEITNDNGNIPLETILEDISPELKETITRKDFSLDNPECLKEVIGASNAITSPDLSQIRNRPQTVKLGEPNWENYELKAENLLKNIPYGKNGSIDLTSYREELDTYSPEYAEKDAQRNVSSLQKSLSKPCENLTRLELDTWLVNQKTNIGSLDASSALSPTAVERKSDLNFNHPYQQLKRSNLEFVNDKKAFAWQLEGKIYINNNYTPEEIAKTEERAAKSENPLRINAEFMKNNNVAQMIFALHEGTHLIQDKKADNQNVFDSPSLVLKRNIFLEKEAFAVEYLAIANIYSSSKEKGITTLSYTDKDGIHTMPLDNVLDLYPGLKDAAKDGFSPQNPEDVRRIVKTATNIWDKEMSETYKSQATAAAKGVYKRKPSISAQLEELHKKTTPETQAAQYDKDIKNMLSNVYIGGNTAVDLTHCRDLLDTGKPEDIVNLGKPNQYEMADVLLSATIEDKKKQMLPEETLLKIDKHLKSQGLKTNQEKDEYIRKAFSAIVTRSPEASQYDDLKNILLETGGSIRYTDRIVETHHPNSDVISYSKNNYNIELPTKDESRNMAANNHTSTINSVLLNRMQQNR